MKHQKKLGKILVTHVMPSAPIKILSNGETKVSSSSSAWLFSHVLSAQQPESFQTRQLHSLRDTGLQS